MTTIILLLTLLIDSLHASLVYVATERDGPYPNDPTKVNPPFITCYEQNKYTYGGFHDDEYMDNPDYPNYTEGDVCDHTSPTTIPKNEFVRNVCKFEVRIDDCVNPLNSNGGGECIKTWSRKCAIDTDDTGSDCPDGWKDAPNGCITAQNSIVCCCAQDFCNKYMDLAIQGWKDESLACQVEESGGCLGQRNVKEMWEGNDDTYSAGSGGIQGMNYRMSTGGADHGISAGGADHGISVGGADHGISVGGADHGISVGGSDHGISAGGSDNGAQDSGSIYVVRVVDAHDLPDEDDDYWMWKRLSDPYVEVYGYVDNSENYKKFQTKVIDSNLNPVWDEEFRFDEAECSGKYTSFMFKVYDSDSLIDDWSILEADFLGETISFDTSVIANCDDYFSEEMILNRGGVEQGTLFIEISKEGCSDDYFSEEMILNRGGVEQGTLFIEISKEGCSD
eukprot:136249_1